MPNTGAMPLTALYDGRLLDLTTCPESLWQQIHKTRPRAPLTCPACRQGTHAKLSPLGLRFFAHDARQVDCALHGETPLHRHLKSALAQLVRTHDGWDAVIEAPSRPDGHEAWRADVLAVAGSRRIAFEVQLAAMTVQEGKMRTSRYAADAVESVWLTTKMPAWVMAIPSLVLRDATPSTNPEQLTVTWGLAKLDGDGGWRPAREGAGVPLAPVLGGLLRGTARPLQIGWFSGEPPAARWFSMSQATAIVPTAEADRWLHAREMKAVREREREEQEKQRARNIDAMYARQEFLLAHAVNAAGTGRVRVWLGVPAQPLPAGASPNLADALGNEKTARGAVVWIGSDRESLTLFAVLSPVAGRVDPALAASWRRRGVKVYAAERSEANRLRRALGSGGLVHLKEANRPLTAVSEETGRRLNAQRVKQQRRALIRQMIGGFGSG
jgi:hypothetical protein